MSLPVNIETELIAETAAGPGERRDGESAEGAARGIELAYFEGLTHSEIAERTGDPLGTVKTRLRSALETLKRAMHP